ncbi:p21-activated protein kinase-interacting protein 1-like [Lytechinus variegatus]|uniref:p21-activated protein kinase-interacting protein 1-like n=1 Tax=Lytechinus variegatus TaxID=7654 RepID=UPI001BB0DEFD|nr:p21-activated protein kinase-interacting protein 1-like [Lytechinus variegatus]
MAKHVRLQVFAGCYERTTFGYDLLENEAEDGSPDFAFKVRFTNNAHTGCIKALAASSRHLASGSTDEIINLYDLEENVELGSLLQHNGSVASLSFHEDGHMISSGEDGVICIWGTKTWECMKILKGHKDAINSVAVHPSGKLALSVSKDKTLRTWNLLKGRAAYTTNIKKVSDIVLWSPDGQLYAVITNDLVEIYDITTASVCCSCKSNVKILSACFLTDRVLVTAGEGEMISLLKVNEKKTKLSQLTEFKAHEKRIKSLRCVNAKGSQSSQTEKWLLSASSDGFLKIWCIDTEKITGCPVLLSEVNSKARLTCLAIRNAPSAVDGEKETTQQATKRSTESNSDDPVVKKKKKSKP